MSTYTTLPTGWNNRFTKPTEDPAPDLVLTGPRPAVVHLPDINSWHPAVLVDDEWFIGKDGFNSSEEALRVAEARARERMTESAP